MEIHAKNLIHHLSHPQSYHIGTLSRNQSSELQMIGWGGGRMGVAVRQTSIPNVLFTPNTPVVNLNI
jgi:hypothetical protein